MPEVAVQATRSPRPTTAVCSCGKTFTLTVDQRHPASRGKPVYCSRECFPRVHPKRATCPCGNEFEASPAQRLRAANGSPVYCSRKCWPRVGSKPGHQCDTLFSLGAFPHPAVHGFCRCRSPATHYATAIYHGNIALVAVCSTCAKRA